MRKKQNKKSQTEMINMKVENDKIKEELRNAIENAEVISKDDKVRMIKSKEEEIEKLKKEILREQHIVAHVQVTQEKEIIEKEKEISILNKILTQERQVLLEKERQIDKLLISKYQVKFSSCQTILNMKTFIIILQEAIVKNEVYGDDSETVTFHDAVSDEEDILIEDLELDNDSNLQHTRNIDDLSLG